jgi:hypothetical protein
MRAKRWLRLGAALALTLATPAAAFDGRQLRIGGWGLSAGSRGLHPSSTWEFGLPRPEILRVIAAIRGPATGRDRNARCRGGPMDFTHFGPLTLNFQHGRWVGWSLAGRETDEAIQSEYGIGLRVRREYVLGFDFEEGEGSVRHTRRGTEFVVDDLHGLLSGPGRRARVTYLWAGANCAFR